MVHITTPQEKNADIEQLTEEAVEKFEVEFSQSWGGVTYYHLVIDKQYPISVCKKVEQIYLEAGWTKVRCINSQDNGEKPGLTGLQLSTNETDF